jgi:cytochrome c oxidase subunit 3/cytochrome o ubiquinol oxidase subunit 3
MADTATVEVMAGHGEHTGHAPHRTTTGLSHNKIGMWLFLASDCLLFGALISTYLLYHDRISELQLGPKEVFDIPFTSVSSFVLLMSSLTMVLALSALQRGDIARNRLWLVVTALLGSTFVGGQVYEFTTFYREGLGYTTNLFGSAFYTMTGFHGIHVTVGIVMLMSLVIKSLRGNLTKENAETVEIIGLYWHFVDIIWILIFTIVYLIEVA